MEGPPGAGEDGQCHGPLEPAHVSELQNRVSSYWVLGFRVYQNCQDVLQNGEFHGPLEIAHVSESQNRVSSYRIFAKQATRSICPLSFIFSNLQKQFKFWRWSPIFQNCKYNSSSDGDLLFSKFTNTIQVLTAISYFAKLDKHGWGLWAICKISGQNKDILGKTRRFPAVLQFGWRNWEFYANQWRKREML